MLAPVHRIRASSTKSIRKLRANSRSLSAVVGTGVPAASAPGSGTGATSVPQILDGMERRGERRSGPAFDNLVLEGMCSFYRRSVHVCRQSAGHVRHDFATTTGNPVRSPLVEKEPGGPPGTAGDTRSERRGTLSVPNWLKIF